MEPNSLNKILDVLKEVDDYMDDSDRKKLLELLTSLNRFANKNKNFRFKYYSNEKKTNSLYRFGWFEFNDELFFVYNWNFRKKTVTFLNKNENIKVVFSINDDDFIKNKELLFPSFFKMLKKKIRYKLKKILKEISEKL